MSRFIYILGGAVFASLFLSNKGFAAHCFADVQITQAGQATLHNNKIWDRRANGKKWRQWDGSHRSECNALGLNHFNSIDLEAFAKENGMCGVITAQGKSWIGTSDKKGQLGPKSITLPCGPGKPITSQENAPSDYQYATKVVCGRPKGGMLHDGDYRTAVNIHNPNYTAVEFRVKFAQAYNGKPGDISHFVDGTLGPDGAQYYDCETMSQFQDMGSFFDGFLVVESREPFDVVGYYTGGEAQVASLDVETTKERLIENNRLWNCGGDRVDLASNQAVVHWSLNGGAPTVVQTLDGAPIFDHGAYEHDDMHIWLSDRSNLSKEQKAGDYVYKLPFCLCSSQEYPTQAIINVTGLRGDNSVSAHLDGNEFIEGPNTHNSANAGAGTISTSDAGQHYLEFRNSNRHDYHAVAFSGVIGFQNGYLGMCQ